MVGQEVLLSSVIRHEVLVFWQYNTKSAAFAEFALNQQTAAMAFDDMFHDGQPQARAAVFARTVFINSEKAFS